MEDHAARNATPPDRVLAAGRRLIFAHGFAAISTDMLAREAKVSKATLYKHFSNLSDVLVAVLRKEAERFEGGVPTYADSWPEFRAAMVQYGTNLLRFLNDPEIIRFSQLVHEEARLHPAIAQPFFTAALSATHGQLTEMITHAERVGYLKCRCTAAETAEQLMGMWEPLRYSKALLGISKRPFPKPGEWAEKCVDSLLAPAVIDRA